MAVMISISGDFCMENMLDPKPNFPSWRAAKPNESYQGRLSATAVLTRGDLVAEMHFHPACIPGIRAIQHQDHLLLCICDIPVPSNTI